MMMMMMMMNEQHKYWCMAMHAQRPETSYNMQETHFITCST